jgi:hypothetical protein
VIPVVRQSREKLERLCRNYRVRRLELFGSAAGDEFDPSTSGLDFLVEFELSSPGRTQMPTSAPRGAVRHADQRAIWRSAGIAS